MLQQPLCECGLSVICWCFLSTHCHIYKLILNWTMDIFCTRVSSPFFSSVTHHVLFQRQSSLKLQQASPKCFCTWVGAVKGLREMLCQREDRNTNNLSKRLFTNCLCTSTAKCRVSNCWIFSLSSDLRQFKKRGVTDTTGNRRTTTASCSSVTQNH